MGASKPRSPRVAKEPKALPSAKSLTVRLPVSLIRRLKAYSGSRDESPCQTVLRSLEREMDGFYFATRSAAELRDPETPILKIG